MKIEKIDRENNLLICSDGNEYMLPESFIKLSDEEIHEQIALSYDVIQKFITEHNYGEIIES